MPGNATMTIRHVLSYAGPMQVLSGGRVNTVWRIGDRVAKLFHEQNATPLFPNSAKDEWRALTCLRGLGIAADPIALHDTAAGPLLVYRHIPSVAGAVNPGDVARLLAKLHQTNPDPKLPPAPVGMGILQQADAMITTDDPLHAHRPTFAPDPVRTGFVHRDPVPANIVNGPDGPRLVDFQCPALGDPAEDIAHFLSPAMQILYGDGPLSSAEITGFLDAYADPIITSHYHTAAPALHWRMACYCQWQVDNGEVAYTHARDAEIAFLSRL